MKLTPSICTSCGHKRSSLFCCIPGEQLNRLETGKLDLRFEPGQIIFSEGNPAFMVYHIFSGHIKLSKTGKNGDQLVVRILGPGDLFGYRAILSNEVYSSTAKVLDPAIICGIHKETFLNILKQSHEFAFKIMERLSHDLRLALEQTISITQESVRQRLARLLLYLIESREEGPKKQNIIAQFLSRIEMAQMIGTTPETLSRTLHGFAQRGLIRVSRSEIHIIDFQKLKLIVREFDPQT
jgi:CRP-like cAMP-binding protein